VPLGAQFEFFGDAAPTRQFVAERVGKAEIGDVVAFAERSRPKVLVIIRGLCRGRPQ